MSDEGKGTINHDPFARVSEVRARAGPGQCNWCGNRRNMLFRYGVESDDGGFRGWAKGLFCGIRCKRSYHM